MTFTIDLGLLSVFVALIGVGLAVYFGLRPPLRALNETISTVAKDVSALREKSDGIWDILVQSRPNNLAGGATIAVKLKTFGEVKVSARPGADDTEYVVNSNEPLLRANFVVRLSRATDLENEEKKFFAGKIPIISDLSPGKVQLRVPSTDPEVCTAYMHKFLEWLDTVYLDAVKREIDRFEQPILDSDAPNKPR